jgi:hypothetical protein
MVMKTFAKRRVVHIGEEEVVIIIRKVEEQVLNG